MMAPILSERVYCVPRPRQLYRRIKFWLHTPRIELELVPEILEKYGLRAIAPPENLGGRRSDNLLLRTSAGKKMLKRYKRTVELEAALYEHSILSYLAKIDFPAPRLAQTTSGKTLVQKGDRLYALFDLLEGYFQYYNYVFLPSQMRHFVYMAGAALGSLHSALMGFVPEGSHPLGFRSPQGERLRDLGWYIDRVSYIRQVMADRGTTGNRLAALLSRNLDWIEQRLVELNESLRAAAPPTTIIHGDYGPYNVFFRAGSPVVILDFELARLEWRLTDLASAVPAFAKGRKHPDPHKMRIFLEGYRTRCPIDDQELALLPDVRQFLALRRVVVCWQRYCSTDDQRWLGEGITKLELARWLEDHRELFRTWLLGKP